jgi:hypothetical protein
MSSDCINIRDVGGADLAQHYPDRGLIDDSNWHNAILTVETDARGLLGRLNSFAIATRAFGAVLSANAEGLRVFLALDQFAVFIPWSATTVSAERSTLATVVRVRTAAVPTITLQFQLDDAAADDLLRGVIAPLPQRDPPRRLLRFKPWALAGLIVAMLWGIGYLASLNRSGAGFILAVIGAGVVLCGALTILKPYIVEEP